MLAEAITFALAQIMSRAEAKKIVTESCQLVLEQKRHLIDVVRERTDAPIDWENLQDETAYFGSSQAFIDRVLEEAKKN
jgi:3-carboxy-cis,cis-muconate cycloisomerase